MLLLSASPASAVTKFISPSGSGTACTAGSPCSMTQANNTAVAGDIVSMAAGTYATAPDPVNSGSSGNPIEYRGDPTNASAVVVPYTTNSGDNYIWFRYFSIITGNGAGMRLNGQFTGWRLAGMIIRGDCFLTGFNQSAMESCTVLPPIVGGALAHNYFTLGGGACPVGGGGATTGSVFRQNNMYFRAEAGHQYCTSADPIFKIWGATVKNMTWERNRVKIVFGPGADDSKRGAYVAGMIHCLSVDSRWDFIDSTAAPSAAKTIFRHRDVFNHNVSLRDSMFTVNCVGSVFMSTDGGPVDCQQVCPEGCCGRDSLGFNRYEAGFYKLDGAPGMNFQLGFNDDTLRYNVIIKNGNATDTNGGGAAIRVGSLDGAAVIEHNTIANFSTNDYGALDHSSDPWDATANLLVRDNIFYRNRTSSSGASYAGRYKLQTGKPYTINRNLYAYFAGPNFSIYEQHGCPSCTGAAQVSPTTFAGSTGQEANGRYGSPLFQDSTFASFDYALRTGSIAIGNGTGGTNIGAWQGAIGPPTDVIAPAAVTTLGYTLPVVGGNNFSVTLLWYTVGDDDLTGIAASYDLRWSTSPITSGNFASATQVTGMPVTQVAGTLQMAGAINLPLNQNVYFAIRATDEVGNVGGISNVISVHQASAPLATGSSVCQ